MLRLAFLLILLPYISPGQGTIRVMQYNLLHYGVNNSFCTALNNNINDKDAYLRTIIGYSNPDVICVNEVGNNVIYSDRILSNVLNIGGPIVYQRASFTTSSNLTNMIFFNSQELQLHSQEQITKDTQGNDIVRLIDLYKLYINNPTMLSNGDTVFITFIVAHLKAGGSSSDETDRDKATQAIMDNLNNKNVSANYILLGDLNLSNSNDAAYQNLMDHPNTKINFIDPINRPGNWNTNFLFADIHTQSTHTSSGCPAGGGLDDRFDFILASQSVMENLDRINYIPGSYMALGQGGTDYNQSLTTTGNAVVPDSVASALYNMSDHLPVIADLQVYDWPSGVVRHDESSPDIRATNPVNDRLTISIDGAGSKRIMLKLYDISGSLLREFALNPGQTGLDVSGWSKGFYFLEFHDGSKTISTFKVVKL